MGHILSSVPQDQRVFRAFIHCTPSPEAAPLKVINPLACVHSLATCYPNFQNVLPQFTYNHRLLPKCTTSCSLPTICTNALKKKKKKKIRERGGEGEGGRGSLSGLRSPQGPVWASSPPPPPPPPSHLLHRPRPTSKVLLTKLTTTTIYFQNDLLTY